MGVTNWQSDFGVTKPAYARTTVCLYKPIHLNCSDYLGIRCQVVRTVELSNGSLILESVILVLGIKSNARDLQVIPIQINPFFAAEGCPKTCNHSSDYVPGFQAGHFGSREKTWLPYRMHRSSAMKSVFPTLLPYAVSNRGNARL